MLAKRYRLPAQEMLGKKSQVVKTPYFTVKIFSAQLPHSRFGVVISKKVASKATARNKLRRIIFSIIETYFLKDAAFPVADRDFLIIISPAVRNLNREEIEMHLRQVFDKLIK